MIKGRNSFKSYLNIYDTMQDEIIVCYRPTLEKGWSDRCLVGDDKYDEYKPYNHRSILHNEIVIEFDDDNKEVNKELALKVIEKIKKDNIAYSLWDSGNKSYHIHFLLDMKQCKNKSLMKKVIMRHYTESLSIQPDMRLAGSHLVRAEFGVNEKSGVCKNKIKETTGYPRVSTLPELMWDKYKKAEEISIKRRISYDLTDLTAHPIVKYLLNSATFQNIVGDGHERTLFMLIHVLKPKYKTREELTKVLQEWYAYSGGIKLKSWEIANKVKYHWKRHYNITTNFLYELCAELGVEPPKIEEIEKHDNNNKVADETRTNGN